MKLYKLALASLISFVFINCELDKPEPLPGFVRIDSLSTDLDYNTQGSNSNNFTEAWFYVDGTLRGVYDLPALFPSLETGTHTILMRPGIKRNGIASTRTDHPLFENLELSNQQINIGDTLVLNPKFKLRSGTNVWFEDFEEAGFKFTNVPTEDTSLIRIANTSDVFEGNGCGYGFIENPDSRFAIFTSENFDFKYGTPVFLEMDYKTKGFIQVRLVVHTFNSGDVVRNVLYALPKLNEQGEAVYNKIYVNLSETIGSEPNASSFDIRIEGVPDLGQYNTEFFIDNIKVLYP